MNSNATHESAAAIPPTPDEAEHRARGREDAPLDADDPFALFARWMGEAEAAEPEDANAAQLATCGGDGAPNVRTILIKRADADGFVIYTHKASAKGREMTDNPNAALCLHWKSLRRQVRVRGRVVAVPDDEADAYFATRARDSRLGAWASLQSAPMEDDGALERRLAEARAKFADAEVTRPDGWGGFRIRPLEIEFWREGPFRLHERLAFRRAAVQDKAWRKQRLYP